MRTRIAVAAAAVLLAPALAACEGDKMTLDCEGPPVSNGVHLECVVTNYEPATTTTEVATTTSTTSTTTSTAPSTTTPDTSTSTTTTTVAPSTSTTTTAPPATTTTTQAPTTSSTTSPTTSTTSTAPTTTSPPSGVQFSEDFSDPDAFAERFDYGWSGEVQAGALFGDAAQDWHGDHDMNCGDPNQTSRTIHVTPPAGEPGAPAGSRKDVSQVFYYCAPGGDPAKGHVMTSMNTEGYVTVWFAPKVVFHDVHRVCFDINLTDMVGSTWPAVNFLTPAEYQGESDLGYTTLDFPDGDGPSSPQGDARYGVSGFNDGGTMSLYNDGSFRGSVSVPQVTDKAGRYQHCIIDNENGTVTLTIVRPAGTPNAGTVAAATVSGQIPNGDIKVEFVHDNYNSDKHQVPPVSRDSSGHYTFHWDNIVIS